MAGEQPSSDRLRKRATSASEDVNIFPSFIAASQPLKTCSRAAEWGKPTQKEQIAMFWGGNGSWRGNYKEIPWEWEKLTAV